LLWIGFCLKYENRGRREYAPGYRRAAPFLCRPTVSPALAPAPRALLNAAGEYRRRARGLRLIVGLASEYISIPSNLKQNPVNKRLRKDTVLKGIAQSEDANRCYAATRALRVM
jgi:hypothetical protein